MTKVLRVSYDFEFMEDGRTIEPLSLGMVREDGPELYFEFAGVDTSKANPWVRQNVLPLLGQRPELVQTRERIRAEVLHFLGWRSVNERYFESLVPGITAQDAEPTQGALLRPAHKLQLWGDYAAYDHVLLAQLWGRMVDLPDGIPYYTNDLRQLMDDEGVTEMPLQMVGVEHNALDDARNIMYALAWLRGHRLLKLRMGVQPTSML